MESRRNSRNVTRWVAALVASLWLAFVSAAHAAAPGRLVVKGADIVDPAGQPILLRGWNWGRWGTALPQDAAENAGQGANAVRIPLRWWGLYPGRVANIDSRDDRAPAGVNPGNLKHLDDMVRWASASKLWIILFIDSDCGQNSLQVSDLKAFCDPTGKYPQGHNFWSDPDARKRFIEVWRFIAARYKDTPYLGFFEPLPEPNPQGVASAQIAAFYDEVMRNIREVAPGVPFIVGGRVYQARATPEVYNPAWKDVVYTCNLFLFAGKGEQATANFRNRANELLEMRQKYKVPVFVQQVGVRPVEDPDGSITRAVLQHLVQQRIGFTYWEYRGSDNPDEYAVHYRRGNAWVPKRIWLDAVSSAFNMRP